MGKERFRAIPASYLVLVKDGKILMLRRFNTGYEDGKYSLPAGHVDEGENFTQCVAREAKEEVGVDVKLEDLKVVHVMHRKSSEGEIGNRIDVFFTAEKWSGEIKNMEPEKCDDLSWFDLNNLPENAIAYVRKAINCIKDKVVYSELGWK
jgi:ADP-ribose pyrophosphatase YjhB (NUDIX family)